MTAAVAATATAMVKLYRQPPKEACGGGGGDCTALPFARVLAGDAVLLGAPGVMPGGGHCDECRDGSARGGDGVCIVGRDVDGGGGEDDGGEDDGGGEVGGAELGGGDGCSGGEVR